MRAPHPRHVETVLRRGYAFATLAALLLLAAAHPVLAQNETNETAANVTITLPVVSPVMQPSWTVTSYYIDNTTLEVVASCAYIGSCPPLRLVVGWNGTIYLNVTLEPTASGEYTRVFYVNASNGAWVYYAYGNYTYNFTVYPPRETGYTLVVLGLIVVGIALGLAVRSSVKAAGVGLLAASLPVYLLTSLGYAPPQAQLISYIMVIAGAVLLYAGRR